MSISCELRLDLSSTGSQVDICGDACGKAHGKARGKARDEAGGEGRGGLEGFGGLVRVVLTLVALPVDVRVLAS